MAERDRPHIVVGDSYTATDGFTSPLSGPRSTAPPSPDDRVGYRDKLTREMAAAITLAEERRAELPEQMPTADGVYLTFESHPDFDLALDPLDAGAAELRAVTRVGDGEDAVQLATVFVTDQARAEFLQKFEAYATEDTRTGKPKNQALVERTAQIRLATVRALWTDGDANFPDENEVVWWEVWLRRRSDTSDRVSDVADAIDARVGQRRLMFNDRLVVTLQASAAQLATSLDLLSDVAEFRRPAPIAAEIDGLDADDQAELVGDRASRLLPPAEDSLRVCLLDSGVSAAHPLLAPGIALEDTHVVDATWSDADVRDHGTGMAGIALYGDVAATLLRSGNELLPFRLESVKILPDAGETEPELWGAVTAEAVARVEIASPGSDRIFMMSVTAEHQGATDPAAAGIPTLWSAALDALAAGRQIVTDDDGITFLDAGDGSEARLVLAAAGNIRETLGVDHLELSDQSPAEAPAQAWNVITVGGCTHLDHHPTEPGFAEYSALAAAGELSPLSRTSVLFDSPWRMTPDIVMEAGNVGRSPSDVVGTIPSLGVLTSRSLSAGGALLTTMEGTSPATAQAANLVGRLRTDQPDLWPETIRALVVGSARWTPAMQHHFGDTVDTRITTLRRYGWGVPDLDRARRSATDALTLVVERTIQPFEAGSMREMHVHQLPWPTDVLADLGATECKLRIALSYFIEPNPARRGWFRRYQYPSHGLRFSVRRPTESTDELRARINKDARDGQTSGHAVDTGSWIIGPQQRHKGSLHVDELTCSAADLAARGCVAVYPSGGWWKDAKASDRDDRPVRYSLVATIETPGVDTDIWTPVAQQVGVDITAPIPIEVDT